ncbi:hypothetical protein GGR53DRAFT_481999 [Hypoxylon sp. FL1150]|nr:hypothetical protein GGR53DRAFT_481999 [Hypoxylon sp. FL1150]
MLTPEPHFYVHLPLVSSLIINRIYRSLKVILSFLNYSTFGLQFLFLLLMLPHKYDERVVVFSCQLLFQSVNAILLGLNILVDCLEFVFRLLNQSFQFLARCHDDGF